MSYTDLDMLRGASLVVAVRNNHDYELNRWCKPQIKLENAAVAGLPVLASDHPCITTDFPDGPVTNQLDTLDDWVIAIQTALRGPRLTNRGFNDDWYVSKIDALCSDLQNG